MMEDLERTWRTFKARGEGSDEWLVDNFRFLGGDHVRSRFVDARVPRDELTLSRQRSVFLLTPTVVAEQVGRRARLQAAAKERQKQTAQKKVQALKNAGNPLSGNRKRPRNQAPVVRVGLADPPLDAEEAAEANALRNMRSRRR